MNTDQLRGKLERVKGTVEQVAGRMLGSRSLIERGRIGMAVGLAREKFGNAKEAVKRRSLAMGRRFGGRT